MTSPRRFLSHFIHPGDTFQDKRRRPPKNSPPNGTLNALHSHNTVSSIIANVQLPDKNEITATRTTESIMKMIAVHFQLHLDASPFRKWNPFEGGKWLELGRRRLFRTGSPGTGVPYGRGHLSVFFMSFDGLLQDEFDL